MELNKEQTREQLIRSLIQWKNFLEPMDRQHQKLMWNAVRERNPLYKTLGF